MKYFIANWKMQLTADKAFDLARQLTKQLKKLKQHQVVICPTFTELSGVQKIIKSTSLALGAQDVFWMDEGAYTGEVSARNLKQLGCEYVLIGHSERRRYLRETDEQINQKIKQALEYDLIPIVCIGELAVERDNDQQQEVIKQQLDKALHKLNLDKTNKILVAYEPVWAIGSGQTITPQQAEQMHAFIKRTLLEIIDPQIATQIPVLYGGSIDSDNSPDILLQPTVDGLLIGGASLDAEQFISIIKNNK